MRLRERQEPRIQCQIVRRLGLSLEKERDWPDRAVDVLLGTRDSATGLVFLGGTRNKHLISFGMEGYVDEVDWHGRSSQ